MQYNIYINQKKAIEWGLSEKEALIISTLIQLPTWAEGKEVDWKIYYYLSPWKLVQELPFLSDNKWSFTNWIKKIKDKNLLFHKIINNKGYYCLTEKIKQWNRSGEGVIGWWDKVSLADESGVTGWWDNNNTNIYNTNNNKNIKQKQKEEIEEIYNHYINKMKIIGSYNMKYNKKALSLERIEKALKNLTKQQLINIIDTYAIEQSDIIRKWYVKMCQYFFWPIERWSKVMFYEEWNKGEETKKEKKEEELIW